MAGDNSLSTCCAIRALERLGADGEASRRQLISLLRDPDPDVRMDAAAALGRLRIADAATPLLSSVAGDPDGEVRMQAVSALARLRPQEAVEPLLTCVHEDGYPELDRLADDLDYGACWEVKRRALEALGEIGDRRVSQPVIDLLTDEDDDDLQESGFRVLARLDGAAARSFLLDRLGNGGPRTRRRAARALVTLPGVGSGGADAHADIRHALDRALSDQDPHVRIHAARALGKLQGSQAAPRLALMLGDPSPEVRAEVAGILGGMRGAGVAESFVSLLDDPDPVARRRIVRVLGEIGDAASADRLGRLLDAGDDGLRYEAVVALGRIASDGFERKIAAILADDSVDGAIRTQAALALANLTGSAESADREDETPGPEGCDPERALLDAAFDPDEAVAFAALSSLVAIDPGAAARCLTGFLRGEGRGEPEPHEAAAVPVRAIAQGDEAEAYLDGLRESDPGSSTLGSILAGFPDNGTEPPPAGTGETGGESVSERVRLHAVQLLGGIRDPGAEAVDALVEITRTGSDEQCREALVALGRVGDARGLATITPFLDSKKLEIRLAALDALVEAKADAPLGRHLRRLLTDPEPVVRERAVRCLACSRSTRAVEVELLRGVLADDDLGVCRAGLDALPLDACTPEIHESLLSLLPRFSGELRREVGGTLRRLGAAANGTTSTLLDALNDAEQAERHWIFIDTLAEIFAARPAEPTMGGDEFELLGG
jgi:HEAT repeat protein